jgi:hypothetical protein
VMHIPGLEQPVKKLPGPFGALQPHNVTLQTYKYDSSEEFEEMMLMGSLHPLSSRQFPRSEIDEAIRMFLDGVQPTENILVQIEGTEQVTSYPPAQDETNLVDRVGPVPKLLRLVGRMAASVIAKFRGR